ncbi:MAG: hypothetical protein ACI4O7_12840 [Aristaeellaceae bacterium]
MDETVYQRMQEYFRRTQSACKAKENALTAEGRTDEAVFEKIRGNVLSLSEAVLRAAMQQEDPAGFFRQRMEQIPAAWAQAREKALAHGDGNRAYLEQIKLEMAEDIRRAFGHIQEGQP